jgi:predicted anti-sigma-YlaC factor YlaD
LDGERAPLPDQLVQAHLAACADCRTWQEQAHLLTRHTRLGPARDVPDLADQIVTAFLAERAASRAGHENALLRLGLVVLALVQFALTVPVLVLGQDHHAPLHVAHELGSFDIALAVGFLVAARRPRRAVGMSTVVGVAALVLVATAAVDLLAGHADVLDESGHLLAVAGWMLLHRLVRTADTDDTTPTAPRLPAVNWLETARALVHRRQGTGSVRPARWPQGPAPAATGEPATPPARRRAG